MCTWYIQVWYSNVYSLTRILISSTEARTKIASIRKWSNMLNIPVLWSDRELFDAVCTFLAASGHRLNQRRTNSVSTLIRRCCKYSVSISLVPLTNYFDHPRWPRRDTFRTHCIHRVLNAVGTECVTPRPPWSYFDQHMSFWYVSHMRNGLKQTNMLTYPASVDA